MSLEKKASYEICWILYGMGLGSISTYLYAGIFPSDGLHMGMFLISGIIYFLIAGLTFAWKYWETHQND